MTRIKKFAILFLVISCCLMSTVALADSPFKQAQSSLTTTGGSTGMESNFLGTLAKIIQYVLGTLGLILLVIFIYAGFLYMTAGGNPEQTKKAKTWMRNGLIGLIITVLSYAIATYIISIMTSST